MADSDVRTKILDIQVRYQDALDKIAKYRKEVVDAMARQKDLKKELDAGNITQEEYARQVETTRIFITQQNTLSCSGAPSCLISQRSMTD